MKKFLKILTCITTAVLCLSGCMKITDTHSENTSDVQIIDWVGSDDAGNAFATRMGNKFEKENDGITIKKIIHDGDRVKDFETAVANKNAPDMIIVSYPMLSRFVERGLIEPLTGYWNDWQEKDSFNKDILEHSIVNGEVYGIPGDCYYMGLVYNKRLFAEAGITKAPETWEELLSYAKRLTDSERQQVGFGLLTGEEIDWWFEYFVWQAGGDLTRRDEYGNIICTFTEDAVICAAEFYRTLKREKVIDPDLNITYADIQEKFAKGQIAMTFGTIGDTGVYTSKGMNKEDIGYAVFPIGPAGKNPSQFGGNTYCINADSRDCIKDGAFKYIAFLRSKEYFEEKYSYNMENDIASLYVSVRNDIEIEKDSMDPETKAVLDEVSNNYRMEYYGKGIVSDYINEALKNILTDDGADIYTQLKMAEDKAGENVK